MEMISEIITGALLSGIVLFFGVTSCAKINKLNTANVFMISFYLGLLTIIVLEGLCIAGIVNYLRFELSIAMLLSMLNLIVLAIYALFVIEKPTSKKMKTLWRLPLIGLLLGYMGIEFQNYINLGVWIVIFIVYIKNYQKLRILTGNIVALFIWVVSLYFIRENSFWYLNSVLIFFSLITYSLWNMISIKVTAWNEYEIE